MLALNDDDEQAKKEMLEICRQKCSGTKLELKLIKIFEEQTIEENAEDAICWYTKNFGMIRSMNDALASGNIERIYSYRYLIKLICRQLKNIQPKYKPESVIDGTLRLYRGQVFKLSDITRMADHQGDLISFKSFLSTSLDEDVAKTFCNGRKKDDHEPVIFKIDVDLTSKQSITFADITNLSNYSSEDEILFSVGATFRINSVRTDENGGFHRVHLSLNPHDQSMVSSYIEQAYPSEASASDLSVLFGKLLFDMTEYQFAIRYYKDRMNNLTGADNHHRPTYLNNLGACYNAIGDKDEALKLYKKAKQIYDLTKNERGLGACYHNVKSFVFISIGFFSPYLDSQLLL